MEAIERRPARSPWLAVLRVLATFASLVTALFWALAFLARWAADADAFAGVRDYLGAVLYFWLTTVLPSLVVPAVHTAVAAALIGRLGERRARAISVAAALPVWPILLLDGGLRSSVPAWGGPLLVLLGLYGWLRGGTLAGRRRPLDRVLEGLGIGITTALLLALAGALAWSWFGAVTSGG